MGVIYLVRHGQARPDAYGRIDPSRDTGPLTEVGRQQAVATGKALAGRVDRIDASFCGDLLRHRETMALIGSEFGALPPPTIEPDWNEYDLDAILGGGGLAATLSGRELQKLVDAGLDDWVAAAEATHPGESHADFQHRCRLALDTAVAAAGSGRTVLVVASAGTISQVVSQVLGLPAADWARFSRTMLNTSISKLSVGRSGTSVLSFNEHSHLETASETRSELLTFR